MNALRALCLALAALCSSAAVAHAVVKQSVPAHGAKLAVAPKEVAITFNEKVEKMFSTASLSDAAGATVATAKARIDPVNPAILRLPLPALQPGTYVVKWTAVGHDGHRRSGDIGFTVN
jgi:methionine-rich copper-binding protein CopC